MKKKHQNQAPCGPLKPLHLQFSPPWQVTAEVGTAVVAVAAVQVNPQHLTCAARAFCTGFSQNMVELPGIYESRGGPI